MEKRDDHFDSDEAVLSEGVRSSLKSFISGGFGGIAAVLVGHPFDLVKVRMQTGSLGASKASVFGILRGTLAREGVAGLYAGVSAPLIGVSPIYAVSFWGYDIGQRIVNVFRDDSRIPMTLWQTAIAGGISAVPTTAIMAPTERIKCLLQVQNLSPTGQKYNGMADCAVQVYRSGGIRSLFKGTSLTLLRDVPGSIAWFGTYEVVKSELMKLQGVEDTTKLSPFAVMIAGGLAGMACWGVCIPPDTLKSRFQTAPDGKYTSVIDVFRQLVKEEGYAGLMTGFKPAMIRAFPANAACFTAMELSRSTLAFLD